MSLSEETESFRGRLMNPLDTAIHISCFSSKVLKLKYYLDSQGTVSYYTNAGVII